MKILRWWQVCGVKIVHPLICLAESIHRFWALFRSSCCKEIRGIWLELVLHQFSLRIPCIARDAHLLLNLISGKFIADFFIHKTESDQFSQTLFISQDLRRVLDRQEFASAFMAKSIPARISLFTWFTGSSDCHCIVVNELYFVKISANWSLFACFDKTKWSKLTRPNKQSKSTLCVLVTCL